MPIYSIPVTQADIEAAVDAVIDAAPGALDTLNEISAALGDDANYAVTTAASIALKAPLASPTFTGTVVLPSTTSIGSVSSTEVGYLDGVTSAIQGQIDLKMDTAGMVDFATVEALGAYALIDGPTFTGTVVLPSTTSIGTVSSTEIGYLDGVTSAVQTQLDTKAPLASPTFTGTVTAPTISATTAIVIPADTYRGMAKVYDAATGDAYGFEQVSQAQTGTSPAVRFFTSSYTGGGNTHIGFGRYTNATAFTYYLHLDHTLATFSVPVTMPTGTSIGDVSSTELQYLNGVTSGVQGQIDLKAPLASPTFTGTPAAPTATTGANTTQIATTQFVTTAVLNAGSTKANIASPTFTGVPSGPTAAPGTDTTQFATTAFVKTAIDALSASGGYDGLYSVMYIAPDGNDGSGNGTAGNPWLTLQKVVTVDPSATVVLAPGTYTGFNISNIIDLKLIGSGPGVVIGDIQAYDGSITSVNGPHSLTINSVRFEQATAAAGSAGSDSDGGAGSGGTAGNTSYLKGLTVITTVDKFGGNGGAGGDAGGGEYAHNGGAGGDGGASGDLWIIDCQVTGNVTLRGGQGGNGGSGSFGSVDFNTGAGGNGGNGGATGYIYYRNSRACISSGVSTVVASTGGSGGGGGMSGSSGSNGSDGYQSVEFSWVYSVNPDAAFVAGAYISGAFHTNVYPPPV